MSGIDKLLAGHTLLGRYRVGEVIGRGGFAVVYEAHDERLDRSVAVKIITLSTQDEAAAAELRARFQREARASAALQHPNVVAIHDFGTDPALGLDFLVMEHLAGEDLRSRLRRTSRVPLAEGIHVLRSTAAGVAAGHQAGIIHRDVKPGNIFLVEQGSDRRGRVCVLDFGIALLAAADDTTRLTQNGVPLSVAYASPEQLTGGAEVTPASDVFSLGVVAYELLGGRRPFSGDALHALEERSTPLPPLRELVPDLDPHVAAAVERAMRLDPAERFPDSGAFADALAAPEESVRITSPAAPAPAAEITQSTQAPPPKKRRRGMLLGGAAVGTAAIAAAALLLSRGGERETAAPAVVAVRDTPAVVAAAPVPVPDSIPVGVDSTPLATGSAAPTPIVPPTEPAPARVPPPAPLGVPTERTASRPATAPAERAPDRPRRTPSAPPVARAPVRAPVPTPRRNPPAGAPGFYENLTHPCQSLASSTDAVACLNRDMAAADAALNQAYRAVMARLDPAEREALRQNQRAWLRKYDAVITSYYSTSWGKHSRVEVLPSQIRALRDRTAYLRRYAAG